MAVSFVSSMGCVMRDCTPRIGLKQWWNRRNKSKKREQEWPTRYLDRILLIPLEYYSSSNIRWRKLPKRSNSQMLLKLQMDGRRSINLRTDIPEELPDPVMASKVKNLGADRLVG